MLLSQSLVDIPWEEEIEEEEKLLNPGCRDPLGVLVQSPDSPDQVLEGQGEVPVDDGQVEPVAVQRPNFVAGLNHQVEFVVLKSEIII